MQSGHFENKGGGRIDTALVKVGFCIWERVFTVISKSKWAVNSRNMTEQTSYVAKKIKNDILIK